jgi:hypothetical protein
MFTIDNFPYFVVGFILLQRLYVYRSLRPYRFIVIAGFLAYRYIHATKSDVSILQMIGLLVDEFKAHCGGCAHSHAKLLLIVKDLLGLILLSQIASFFYHLTNWNINGAFKDLTDYGFNLVKDLSFVKGTLEHEQQKLESSFDKDLKIKSRALGDINNELPAKGLGKDEILKLIESSTAKEDIIWQKGHISGAVYNGNKDHIDFLNKCYSYYSIANPLHADIWPSLMKFESEIIAMTASLVNNGLSTVCGTTSSVSSVFPCVLLSFPCMVLGWN